MGLVITVGAAVVCGAAWFVVSWLVIKEPAGDAVGEAFGVAFGVLIVVSVVGALRAFSRRSEVAAADPGEDPERPS
jgi:hypothetical protein